MGLNSDFDFVCASTFHSQFWCLPHQNGFVTKDRSVMYYEIEFFLEDAQSTFINGVAYPILKNHILVGKPGQIRHSILDFSCLYVYLDPKSDAIRDLLDGLPTLFEISNPSQYMALFHDLIDAKLTEFEGQDLLVSSKIYELLYKMHIDSRKTSDKSISHNKISLENSRQFINQNYTQSLHLEDIAAAANLSPAYFHKLFKVLYGQTPGEYLQEVRLTAAKKMLLTSNVSIEEIAFTCGFSSQAYFNAVFKKCTGLSPLKFKSQSLDKYKI